MSSRSTRKLLGYDFTPTARAAIRAVADGDLDWCNYAILAALYDHDVPRNLHVRFTLDQLAEWIAWAKTSDGLSKRLRRLRDDGWLFYESPSKPPYRYSVTLMAEPTRSDVGPRSHPASRAAASGLGDAVPPSTTLSGPSSKTAQYDLATTSETNGGAAAVRPSQRVQRNPSSLEETVGPNVSVDVARAREAVGPSEDPAADVIVAGRWKLPEREEAILDEISDVFGGALQIVGPLPPGRVLERVEGHGIVVELVVVDHEEFKAAKARGQYEVFGEQRCSDRKDRND